MRRLFMTGLGLSVILYLLPAVWSLTGTAEPPELLTVPQTVAGEIKNEGGGQPTITVQLQGTPVEMPLEQYVEGVTAAEIPNDFPIEAIRAQAVAARTYAVYKCRLGRPDVHPDADVCDNFSHCAAYRDPAAAAAAGTGLDRVRQAVQDTAGQILTCQGAPIAAVFHSASGPRTEAARDVWGEDVPYLQSVVSPGGSASSEYEDTVTVPADEFRKKVNEAFPSADVSGAPRTWFKASERSDAGGIITVKLGGIPVEGAAVRTLFGLHSTNFTITTTEDSISFHTIGYGHGVGLSQYGARYMAEQGASYTDILTHYYKDTVLSNV